MIPNLDNAVLGSLLDCQNFDLLNVGSMIPVPDGLVDLNDPELNDPRVPPIASVTNEHVSSTAEIEQSKLSLDGEIPSDWLGTDETQAAQGDLAESLLNKGVPNGYPEVDANLRLFTANVTAGAGLGTVSEVTLSFPSPVTSGGTIDSSGTVAVDWSDAPNRSWLGVNGPFEFSYDFIPSFLTSPMPEDIVPDLDASTFVSGQFSVEQLPVAVGSTEGAGSSAGIVPDPGEFGEQTDYLGRDMEWHTFGVDIASQPTAPTPVISLDSWTEDEVFVTVRSVLPGSSIFIRINDGPWRVGKIKKGEADVHDTISVHDGDIVWAYTAKAGYNNSVFIPGGHINPWKVVTPLTEI